MRIPNRPASRMARLAVPLLCGFAAACGGRFPEYGSSEEAVCAGGTIVQGVDVSVFQGSVNWASVKASGRGFAIARISDGTYLDTEFATNWSGIKAAGMVRGAYQFFEPGEDPDAQATIVANAVGVLGAGDLPVVADMEVTGSQTAATIAANLQTWMTKVKASTGKQPMVYTAEGYWNGSVGSTAFGADPLWVANWGVTCPTLPTGWSTFKVWQYADNGTVSGISGAVDLDEFNGSATDLQTFAGGAPAYAAQFVSQTWPYATTTIPMTAGQILQESLVLKNVGTATWDSNTRLGTTQPRDRASPFANATWVGANRLAGVTGTVAPGATFSFDFEWQAPATPGSYDEFYGVVQDGVTWFSDPGQGGPPDNQIEAKIDVTAGPDAGPPRVDAGPEDAGGTGNHTDAGASEDAGRPEGADGGEQAVGGRDAGHDEDAGSTDAAVTEESDAGTSPADSVDAGSGRPGSGCGCASSSGTPLPAALIGLFLWAIAPHGRRRAELP